MNVLFLSYDGLTDPLGQSQILPYLSGLSAKGAKIQIISFEKPERFEKHQSIIKKIIADNNLVWHPLQYTKRPPVLSTMYDIWKMKNLAQQIIAENNIEILHCRSYLSAIIGSWAQKKLGTKFIFDMRGFYPDERVEGKIWSLKNPVFKSIYSFFKRKEKQWLKECDQIITLTFAGKKEMLTWNLQIDESKINVIPCCVDVDFFDRKKVENSARQTIRTELNIAANDTVFIYTGGIGTWYCLDEMMQFFKVYQSKFTNSKFLILTTENPSVIFAAAAKNKVAKELLRVTESPRNRMPAYLTAADIALFFILPSYSKTASSPTKQGEMMAMQLPIVCNDNVGDTGFVIRKYNAGWVVENFSEVEFEKTITAIVANPISELETIRHGADEFYGLKNGVENYWNVYKKSLGQK